LLGRFDKIRARVRAERPDVLEAHSQYLAAAAVLACGRKAARVRTIFWHADHVGTYVKPAIGARLGPRAADAVARPISYALCACLARFDATFVAGVAQAEGLRSLGARNVIHAPFGVDAETFRPDARSEARRRELCAGRNGPLLVGVGRFAFEKRWDVVLDAFARVRARRADATLVLFGDGPERARLAARAPVGVVFAGFEDDRGRLATALASADMLVHGCPYETFGIGVAEAVASALPVVVPDAGGAAESLDPSCGEAYRSLDADACAAAVERLLARDSRELRANARGAAARVRTREEHVRGVLSVYDDLLRAC
jgi:alpha-1,6-mannosyltransferase